MTVDELRARLRALHARIGGEGRFSFTMDQSAAEDCHVTHWVRKSALDYEDCRVVGAGTVADCLKAAESYCASFKRKPSHIEVGRTLGIITAQQRQAAE